jgi:hypothetical protein
MSPEKKKLFFTLRPMIHKQSHLAKTVTKFHAFEMTEANTNDNNKEYFWQH